jgi:hypothetical protein
MGQHDGTYDTDVTLGAPGALASGGTAALFTLDSGTITIGRVFEFPNTDPFSIEAWVNPTASPLSGSIIATNTFSPPPTYPLRTAPPIS